MQIALTFRENCKSLNGTWCFPGGKFDDNELYLLDSMRRELQEETNLTLESETIHLIGVQEELTDGTAWLNFVFTGCTSHPEMLHNCEPHKFREVRWVDWNLESATFLDQTVTPISHISQEALITFRGWLVTNETRLPLKTVTQATALGCSVL